MKRQKDGLSKGMFCIDKNNYEPPHAQLICTYTLMKLVHILYKNPCISLLLEKERVVSYVKCLDEHINISLKLILIIGCSQISLNKLSLSSRLWFDTWKKCAKTKKYAGPKRQILHSRIHAQIASRTRILRTWLLNQIL